MIARATLTTSIFVAAIVAAAASVATADPNATSAATMRDCGTVKTESGGRFDITATRKVPCKSARKVGRSFINGGWTSHGGPSSAETYYTNSAYPGWECGSGTGGGGCRKNDSNSRRILIQQS